MPFPLPLVPKLSYKAHGRRFGADRDGGARKHAGCDLIAKEGTEIFAVDNGVVWEWTGKEFYRGTYALAIRHTGGYIVRYCEIKNPAPGIQRGTEVKAGQVIANVGKMFRDSMLHFELYAGTKGGPLTNRLNKPFQRRGDLLDPSAFLDYLARFVMCSHPLAMPIAGAGGIWVPSKLASATP